MDTTEIKEKKEKVSVSDKISSIKLFLKGSVRYFVLCVLCAFGVTITEMISPQIVRVTVDSVIGNEPLDLPGFLIDAVNGLGGTAFFKTHLYYIAAMIAVVAVFAALFQYAFRITNSLGAETFIKTMRDRLFKHIEHLPFSWHMKNHTGDIIQRCTSDADTIKRFLSEQLINLFRIIVMVVLSLIFMFSMNVKLTVIALVFMPFIIGYSFRFHKKIGKAFRECDEDEGKLSAVAQENLTGVRVVRAFGREAYERERFESRNTKYMNLLVKLTVTLSSFWSSSDFLSGLQIIAVIVFGSVEAVRGNITAGQFIAFVSYNSMLSWPIRSLGRMISDMSRADVSLGRIAYIMSSETEHDRDNAKMPDMRGDIVFDKVSFGYDESNRILDDVSFTIKAGSTFGILGGTGSGKSTLMHLLDKLYDLPAENGKITVSGVDISDIKSDWIRSNIGMVLQEPFLFSRTISENIGITREDITLSDIRDAAATACLDDTIGGFSKGYDTFVGERGVTLSGGQKQRAAIARMLTQKTPIMVFDDSLSAVDTETDAKIRSALNKTLGDSTVILISHRITTLMSADKIIVLDKGRVAECGTHAELLALGGIYKKIYDIQTQGSEDNE